MLHHYREFDVSARDLAFMFSVESFRGGLLDQKDEVNLYKISSAWEACHLTVRYTGLLSKTALLQTHTSERI